MEWNYEVSHDNSPKKSNIAKYFLILFVVLFLLGVGGAAVYFYSRYNDLQKDPSKVAARDAAGTVAAVSKIMDLPTNEDPTVATVTDPSKLGNQDFFAHAKVGDKVLLYAKAKKAILYDPVANKIVEAAPLNVDDANAPGTTGTTQTK